MLTIVYSHVFLDFLIKDSCPLWLLPIVGTKPKFLISFSSFLRIELFNIIFICISHFNK